MVRLMDEIKEPALIDASKNGAVEYLIIKQTENGFYQLILKLSWKRQISILVTSRGTFKEWANYERLIKRIKESYLGIPVIKVEMNYEYLIEQTRLLPNIKEITYDKFFIKTEAKGK